jgi:hypothetical protein
MTVNDKEQFHRDEDKFNNSDEPYLHGRNIRGCIAFVDWIVGNYAVKTLTGFNWHN